VPRHRIAAIDADGTITPWAPDPDDRVTALAVSSATVYVGGDFTSIGGEARSAFAIFVDPAPTATALPLLTGTPHPGQTLSCSTGSWDGPPTSYAYRWLRDGAAIGDQTAATYVVADGDVGHDLACQVTAANVSGSATAMSVAVDVSALQDGGGLPQTPPPALPAPTPTPRPTPTPPAPPVTKPKAKTPKPATGKAKTSVTEKTAGKLSWKARSGKTVVLSGSSTFTKKGKRSITLTLNPAGRKLLAKQHRLKVTVTFTFTPKRGKAMTMHKVITFKSTG
jgi:hypothetical protein